MLSHEVESALRGKAENWDLNNTKMELSRVTGRVNSLEEELHRKQNSINNLNEVVTQLLSILQEEDDDTRNDRLQSLVGYI